METPFTSPEAMRLAIVLSGVGTYEDARVLSLRELRSIFADLSETEREAGRVAERAKRAERLAQMGATV